MMKAWDLRIYGFGVWGLGFDGLNMATPYKLLHTHRNSPKEEPKLVWRLQCRGSLFYRRWEIECPVRKVWASGLKTT